MASLCSDIAKDVEERCLQRYVEQRLGCGVETSQKFFRWGSFGLFIQMYVQSFLAMSRAGNTKE